MYTIHQIMSRDSISMPAPPPTCYKKVHTIHQINEWVLENY